MTNKIAFVDADGLRKYSLSDLETVTQRNMFFLVREMETATRSKLVYDDDYIEEESFHLFAKWFNSTYEDRIPIKIVNKRAYSTTHRIEIAYKSKYRCNACNCLLPPTFEVDHIVELRDGGKDEYDNLQALCNNCHAAKTRANTLKRDEAFAREFGKRARDMETSAFEKFKYKKSKYFSD
tara:strand:+ start:335 stop:874 length:540 start_codon:yes stop_codon:yes gene_type:complete